MKHFVPEETVTPEDGDKREGERAGRRHVHVFGRAVPVPASRAGRIALGSGLVVGGIFSFLPVLGLWMLPLGALVLAQDIAFVRRQRRKLTVRFTRWRQRNDEKRGG